MGEPARNYNSPKRVRSSALAKIDQLGVDQESTKLLPRAAYWERQLFVSFLFFGRCWHRFGGFRRHRWAAANAVGLDNRLDRGFATIAHPCHMAPEEPTAGGQANKTQP
jgi:hypothetical protein